MAEPPTVAAAAACIGCALDDVEGHSVGRVEAVLADQLEGTPTWLVVRTRRFGRRACVPAATTAAMGDRAWAPYSRETIRASSEIDCAAGLTCGDERALAGHYGFPASDSRLAAIAGRDDGDDGSVPAQL
jgi:hypothetical protein